MSTLPNIVLIVLDTLREDYSTSLDSILVKEGFCKLPNCISPSPWTIPSHVSMLSGEYPSVHGTHETPVKKADEVRVLQRIKLLNYVLKKKGYRTYLFTSNPYVHPLFGFSPFDIVIERFLGNKKDILTISERAVIKDLRHSYGKVRTFVKLLKQGHFSILMKLPIHYLLHAFYTLYKISPFYAIDMGTRKLIRDISKVSLNPPFFLLVNIMEMHEPYLKDQNKDINLKNLRANFIPEMLNNIDLDSIRDEYLRRSKQLGEYISQLLGILKEKMLFDNSVIIITSDHGQLLGEYGKIGHGTFLYDELLKVPFFIKIPGWDCTINLEQNKWLSLTRVWDIVTTLVYFQNMNNIDIEKFIFGLYSDVVFSESFGIAQNISNIPEADKVRMEKHRIAIYHGPYKGIYNVDDNVLEFIKPYDPNAEITEDVKIMLIKDAKKFLKQAKLKSAIRKINIRKNF
ncbi:sulfatase-like hydrolase/transferase [Pyrococcus sp. ST04]|uniref:sulfatase-like hydrolase/transferase n=1 Tax=Pyrococcus sp. ST04 TaxID=1183377 RepID=UPI0002605A9C|nr:sulfatase-like hydrolase/transferase [Pyrococcus sp. ST04]AFK22093.1 hypothetical protein Py04_0491 [Pyrococcus sp. ST04]